MRQSQVFQCVPRNKGSCEILSQEKFKNGSQIGYFCKFTRHARKS
jgi:hypothetical protein